MRCSIAASRLYGAGRRFPFRQRRPSGLLERLFAPRAVVDLQLVDPRFYHLDTCFCPLEGGYVMYYPPAFDPESRDKNYRRP